MFTFPQDHSLYDHYRDTACGSLLGLALGDALGTTLEFTPKASVSPIADMLGGGPFGLKAGQWTDDTSMILCLADSLIERGDNDLVDQLARYSRWQRHGENSCTGHCFDIGMTVRQALSVFERTGDPYAGSEDEYSAGNGSLMRIAPVAAFFCRHDVETAMAAAAQSSKTTHREQRAVEACELMTLLLHHLLNSTERQDKLEFLTSVLARYKELRPECHEQIARICDTNYLALERNDVRGTGFVIDSLTAALWCFAHANDFAHGALLAANLGDDADTTAAIYGQLAGAYWGENGLPECWLSKLAWRELIQEKATLLVSRPSNQSIRNGLARIQAAISNNKLDIGLLLSVSYEFGMVLSHCYYERVFDDKPWVDGEAEYWFSTASLEQCLLCLTAMIRKDRILEGLIDREIRQGTVHVMVKRMLELTTL